MPCCMDLVAERKISVAVIYWLHVPRNLIEAYDYFVESGIQYTVL